MLSHFENGPGNPGTFLLVYSRNEPSFPDSFLNDWLTREATHIDILSEVVSECCYILKVDLGILEHFYWFILEMNQVSLMHF